MALGKRKAAKILRHGEVRGRKLTSRARRYMGARASGQPVKRTRKVAKPKGYF